MPTEQQQINYGNTANDGQGDPLRTAFIKTDDNFTAIWNAGPVGSNVTILNSTVSVVSTNGNLGIAANGIGVIETRSSLIPRLANSYDLGSANLRYRSAYIGSGGLDVTGNLTLAGSFTISDLRVNTIASDDSSFVVVQDGLAVSGALETESIYTDSYFYANGAPFNPGSDYGNSNVAAFLVDYEGNISANFVNMTGTLSAGNIVTATANLDALVNDSPITIQTNGNVWTFADSIFRSPSNGSWQGSANTEFISSNPNGFINLISYSAGNLATELFMEHGFVRIRVDNGGPEQDWNFRVNGALEVPGDIIPQANATQSLGNATNYWSNLWVANNTIYIGGVPLGVTGNVLTVNGEAVLSNDSASSITTTGNITAGNISTGIVSADYVQFLDGGSLTESYISETGFIVGSNNSATLATLQAEDVRIITDFNGGSTTWTFGANGQLSAPGNITAGNILATGNMDAQNLVVTNLADIGDISIAGGYITLVDGSASTGIDISPNAEGQAFLQVPNDATANTANLRVVNNAGNVRIETNAGNIWTFGYDGDLTAPGNISGTNFIVSESLIGSDASPQPTISGFSTISATGNVTGGNLTTSGQVVATGNITGGNMQATSYRNASGVSILGNFSLTDNTIQTGNGVGGITLKIFGPDATDPPALIDREWVFGNTGTFTSPGTISTSGDVNANYITATANIAGGNLIVTDTVYGLDLGFTGTANLATVNATGNITGANLITTGNVVAPKFIGNGLFNGTTSIEIPTANSNIYVGFGLVGSIEFNAEGVTALNLAATGNVTGATANISGNISGANLITTGNVVGNVSGFAIGYRDIPQVAFTGNATIATTDAGKHFYSTESTDYILTIADNSAVSWPVGTAVTIVNRGTGNITVAQASGVSLYLAGNSTAGNRTVSTYGMATVLNVAANVWMINGTGVA